MVTRLHPSKFIFQSRVKKIRKTKTEFLERFVEDVAKKVFIIKIEKRLNMKDDHGENNIRIVNRKQIDL